MGEAVLQYASPVRSGVAPCRTPWGAREQHKTASSVRQLAEKCADLQPAYSVGERHYGLGLATIFFCAYRNALQVFQGRRHPEMS